MARRQRSHHRQDPVTAIQNRDRHNTDEPGATCLPRSRAGSGPCGVVSKPLQVPSGWDAICGVGSGLSSTREDSARCSREVSRGMPRSDTLKADRTPLQRPYGMTQSAAAGAEPSEAEFVMVAVVGDDLARTSVRARDAAADRDCVQRVAAGDQEAFAELCRRYWPRCRHIAGRVLQAEHHVDDVAQAVLLDVWRQAARFDAGRASVAAWITTMAHNKAVDVVRREDQHRRRRADEHAMVGLRDDTSGPEDQALRAAEGVRVRAALATLSHVQRELIELAYYRNYTYVEIAQTLHVPLGTVKTRGRSALLRLRLALEAEFGPLSAKR